MSRPGRFLRSLPLLVCSLLLGARPASAQTTGSIEGRVVDPAGSPLPGVSVQATSPSLQGARTTVTGSDGRYRFPAMPPGTYRVEASLPGFPSVEKSATVTLDATATVDLMLRLTTEAQVVVSGEAPAIDSTSTTTGTSYSTNVVTRLPVARNYADIVRSNPGVLQDMGETQGRSLALSIYGSTSVENQWVIDGVNTTNVLKGMQGKAINNEFVQEVQVKTGAYQAEYGRALGGVVNVITKSGGNTYHGDGFVYYDSGALQAERVFVPGVDSDLTGMRVSSYTRTDYGVDLGGFILKDRLWIFGAYNRVSGPSMISPYVETDLVTTSMKFPYDTTDNLYSGKLTWNIAASTTLVGSVFADPSIVSGALVQPVANPDPGTWQGTRSIGGLDYGLRLNQLFGASSLATLQAARHEDKFSLVPTGAGTAVRVTDWTCEGGTPDQACDIPGQPNSATGGLGFIFGWLDHSKSHRDQVRADGTLYRGPHEIKVGGDYQNGNTQDATFWTGGQAVHHYNEYGQDYYRHGFFARSFDDLTPVDWPNAAVTRDFGVYAQDSWKVTPSLTINAGLRLDREWIVNYAGTAVIQTNEWQPRVGVTWDPFGDGNTKIYGFVGRFSYGLPTDLALRVYGSNVYVQTYNFDPNSTAQDPNVLHHETADKFGSTNGEPVDPGLKGISQNELTLGVEKSIGPSLWLGLKATYRSLAQAIEDRGDLDYTVPENGGSSYALVNPGSSGPYARGDFYSCTGLDYPFDNCKDGTLVYGAPPTPKAKRIYRGIELVARESFSQRAWAQLSYVFSSLRGNYDGEVSEGYFGGQTDPGINADFDYPQMWHNGYGRLFLDRPQQLRLDGYYTLPFGLTMGLQAWLRSGAPLNQLGYLNSNYGAVVQLVPKGYAGRLPMEWDANLTASYPIAIGPATLTLQAYVFNLFNNQIETASDTTWTDQPPNTYPVTLYDPHQPSTNTNYGKTTNRTSPRLFRAAIKISF